MAKTAGIIIIGNEILSGKTQDTNSYYLASELRKLGVNVRRIVVVPDDIDAIAAEVAVQSEKYDYVFTAGGVGPTHDDVTMQGIAKAFNLKTVTNQKILEVIKERCGNRLNEPTMRMAELPEGAEVIEVEGLRFPPIVLKNVFIFPGIPEFLRQKFSAIKERFRSEPFILKKIYVKEEECFIAHYLEKVTSEFPDVVVGSYPKVGVDEYKVVVTLESTSQDSLSKAYDFLIGLLPENVVVRTEGT
jgi:molybdenum cofactor synthesis domain-containing protein